MRRETKRGAQARWCASRGRPAGADAYQPVNYLDRFVPSAVLPELKSSGIVATDFQLGFLSPGFLLVYMLAAPVFGDVGDRRSAPVPSPSAAPWSLATLGSGLARTYWQLFASRAAVGIGEAAYATISPALLADYYPATQRGRILPSSTWPRPSAGHWVAWSAARPPSCGAGGPPSSLPRRRACCWRCGCCGRRTRRAVPWNTGTRTPPQVRRPEARHGRECSGHCGRRWRFTGSSRSRVPMRSPCWATPPTPSPLADSPSGCPLSWNASARCR